VHPDAQAGHRLHHDRQHHRDRDRSLRPAGHEPDPLSPGPARGRYQENYREKWGLGEAVFDFDTWPDLPTFVEIEGPDEASVRRAAAAAGLDYAAARFGSVDEIYRSELGRDILAEPTLLFARAENAR
jgi:adenylate cyclase class 2